jgi:hypothetical protein
LRGFGQKNLPKDSSGEFIVTKGNELSEIEKVKEFLDPDETVHIVAKQTRRKPGGAIMLAPNSIIVSNKRLIITNPSMAGLRKSIQDFPYDKIVGIKLQKGIFTSTIDITTAGMGSQGKPGHFGNRWGKGEDNAIDGIEKNKGDEIVKFVRTKMEEIKNTNQQAANQQAANQQAANQQAASNPTTEDPLTLLKKRFVMGEITKEEFEEMKQILEG